MTKGAWLGGYYTSPPFLAADGTLFFFRNSTLMAARDLLIDEQLELGLPDDRLCSTEIVSGDRSLYFAYMRPTATEETARLVRVDY